MGHAIRTRIPPVVLQALEIVLLLLVFLIVNTAVERLTRLPGESYFEPSLLVGMAERLAWPWLLAVAVGAAALAWFGRLFAGWDDLEYGRQIRLFIVVVAAAVCWPLVTAGYNYYFDQEYAIEKLAVVALLPLAWWRPVFVYPLVTLAYLLLWQLGEPRIGGSHLPHKLQLLHVLNLFAAAFLVHSVYGKRSMRAFLVLVCCLVASSYWLPALAKLELHWLSEDRLHLIPLAAYAHGWLAFWPAERIVEFSRFIMPLNILMGLFVLAVESLCLVMLWHRRLCATVLVLVVVFHLGVFALYGFLFWTWIVLDAALLWLILRVTRDDRQALFNVPVAAISVVLIAFGAWWARPPELAWYDTPLSYTYHVEAVDDSGQRTSVRPGFFAPYDDIFAMSGFSYLVPDRAVLVNSYGVTRNRELFHRLVDAKNATDILNIERDSDLNRFDAVRSRRFQALVRRFIENRARGGEHHDWVRAVRAPPQFWSLRGETPRATDIREIILVEVTSFFDGTELREIRRRDLFRMKMESPSAPQANLN